MNKAPFSFVILTLGILLYPGEVKAGLKDYCLEKLGGFVELFLPPLADRLYGLALSDFSKYGREKMLRDPGPKDGDITSRDNAINEVAEAMRRDLKILEAQDPKGRARVRYLVRYTAATVGPHTGGFQFWDASEGGIWLMQKGEWQNVRNAIHVSTLECLNRLSTPEALEAIAWNLSAPPDSTPYKRARKILADKNEEPAVVEAMRNVLAQGQKELKRYRKYDDQAHAAHAEELIKVLGDLLGSSP